MQDATHQPSEALLMWLLLLLIATLILFAWRCHRAGVLASFGHTAATTTALVRLAIAACMPAALSAIWLVANPALGSWAALGTAHLAVAWYGQRWLLPDGLVLPTHGALT